MVKAAFDFCEAEARKHDVPMPSGAPQPAEGGGASSSDHVAAAPAVAANPPPPIPAVADPPAGRKIKLPHNIPGIWKATLSQEQPDSARKQFAVAVPWHPDFQLGATLRFTSNDGGLPNITFQVSTDNAANGRALSVTFSLPSAFAMGSVNLSGMQIVALAKKSKKKAAAAQQADTAAHPPAKQAATDASKAARKKPVPPPPPPPPPLEDYNPGPDFAVISEPPSAVEIGCYVAHRWDVTPDFPRGWYEGKVVKMAPGKRFAGQYEVEYEGFKPSTYYHKLSLGDYGVGKVWVGVVAK